MNRRYIHSEPNSRLAIWARRMAGFAFAAAFLAMIVVRSGMLEVKPALATLGGALATAVVALLLALAAYAVIWMEGLAGMRAALAAMAISLLLLAYPAYLGVRAYRLPWIYDITTDPIDPPRYEALARARPRDANPVIYTGLYTAEQQRNAEKPYRGWEGFVRKPRRSDFVQRGLDQPEARSGEDDHGSK